MSAVVSGLIGGFVAAALVALARRRRTAARLDADGWRTLRPGWMINLAFILSAALAAFCFYVWMFVGSSRPDADKQMMICLLLGVGFALGAVGAGWAGYGRRISWKGDELRIRRLGGGEIVQRFADIAGVTKKDALGEYHIDFRDGSRLRLSTYFRGVEELAETLRGEAPPS